MKLSRHTNHFHASADLEFDVKAFLPASFPPSPDPKCGPGSCPRLVECIGLKARSEISMHRTTCFPQHPVSAKTERNDVLVRKRFAAASAVDTLADGLGELGGLLEAWCLEQATLRNRANEWRCAATLPIRGARGRLPDSVVSTNAS